MTYEPFFELNENPFKLSPDPEYYFPSHVHKEVMRHLLYSISTEEGFVEITGQPGIGKTITVRSLLMQIGEEVQVALIIDPKIKPQELVNIVARDLGLPQDNQNPSNEHTLRMLQHHLIQLHEQGIVSVIIVDEAQNLSDETLEQLCLISNIETDKQKLVKIILVGQLELSRNLRRPELLKIYQRITIRYRLSPLSFDDSIAYIQHRIRVAGGSDSTQPWFSKSVYHLIYKYSNGLPRIINIICDRSLMAAYSQKSRIIKRSHVNKALKSFQDQDDIAAYYRKYRRIRYLSVILICLIVLYFTLPWLYQPDTQHPPSKQSYQPPIDSLAPSEEKTKSETAKPPQALTESENQTSGQSTENIGLPEQSRPEPSDMTRQVTETAIKKTGTRKDPTKNFPDNLIVMPSTAQNVIVYFPDINRIMLWQSTENGRRLLKEESLYVNLREGVYLLGIHVSHQPFLFHPTMVTGARAETLAKKIIKIMPLDVGQLVPILVYLSDKSFQSPLYAESQKIQSIVKDWAQAWQTKKLETFLDFYDRDNLHYHYINNTAKQISWQHFKQSKSNTFARASKLDIGIDKLVTSVDPGNPKFALALFYQTYSASSYSDQGIKCLFFNQVFEKQQARWLISGRLWMPLDKKIFKQRKVMGNE